MKCDPFTTQLEHLSALALSEFRAWKVYAWQRAKELEASQCGQWKGLTHELQRVVELGQQSGTKPD